VGRKSSLWVGALLLAGGIRAEDRPLISRREAVAWGAGGGTIILASLVLDSRIKDGVERTVNGRLGKQLDGQEFGRSGGWLEMLGRTETALTANGLLYLGGSLSGAPRLKHYSLVATEAVLAVGLADLTVKYSVGRKRPESETDSDHYRPFHGTSKEWVSFPSGHTATAFAWASVTAEEFPSPWVSVGAYGVAGAVGFARIYQSRHWGSDIVGGATLGFLVGKIVYRWSARRNSPFVFEINGRSFCFAYRWS
jgi:membrane-associated phospholipid phosphatase